MTSDFQLSGGSVAGRDHRKMVPKNRQDDFCIMRRPDLSVAIVADGCGSSGLASRYMHSLHCAGSSEVGASLGVRLLSNLVSRYFDAGYHRFNAEILERMRRDLVAQLHVLASNMGYSLGEVVDRYFLFTLVGAIITDEYATFFALGDGVIIVNGEQFVLEPDEGNLPVYLGYALTGSSLTDDEPARLNFSIVAELPTPDLLHFVVGTDGVMDCIRHADTQLPGLSYPFGEISQFWTEGQYLSNRSAVERRLNLAARDWPKRLPDGTSVLEGGLLYDDTTMVVGRRQQEE